MESLLQVRNFQNMLKRELNWRSRARVSAVCKASRDALCDKESVRRNFQRVSRSLEDLNSDLQTEERLEEELHISMNDYFDEPLSIEAERIASFLKISENKEYILLMAAILIAFAMDYPEYAKHLKDPEASQGSIDALSRGFVESGVWYAMLNVENMLGSIVVRDSVSTIELKSPQGVPFFWYDAENVLLAVRRILENQFRAGVYENLDAMLERARKLVFKPFSELQAHKVKVSQRVKQLSSDVRRLGIKRLSKDFRTLTKVYSSTQEAWPVLRRVRKTFSNAVLSRFPVF